MSISGCALRLNQNSGANACLQDGSHPNGVIVGHLSIQRLHEAVICQVCVYPKLQHIHPLLARAF